MSDTFVQRKTLALGMICLLLLSLQYLIIKMKDQKYLLDHLFTFI